MSKFRIYISLTILIVSAFLLLSSNLSKPFIGHHDWNGVFWGNYVRNYLNYFGLIPKDSPHYIEVVHYRDLYYRNYTPLLPLILTTGPLVFGLNEWSLRLVPLFFSLILIFFIYKVGRLLFDRKTAILAAVFTIITPLFLYFGKLPDHEPIVVSLVVVTIYAFLKSRTNRGDILFLLMLTFALLESWPAFFVLIPLVLFCVFVRKDKFSRIFSIFMVAIFVIVAHLSPLFVIKGSISVFGFFEQGFFRVGTMGSPIIPSFNTAQFTITLARYAAVYFTKILLILTLLWFLFVVSQIWRKKTQFGDKVLLILFLYPIFFVLTFRQLVFIHDYKIYHFLPFVTLASARAVSILIENLERFVFKYLILINKDFLKITLLATLIVFTFTERLEFLNTLFKTNASKEGYELGLILENTTNMKDKILVLSGQFGAHFGVFTNFYANRSIDYLDYGIEDLKNLDVSRNYDYVVYVFHRDTPVSVLIDLKKKYYSFATNKFEVFKLNHE